MKDDLKAVLMLVAIVIMLVAQYLISDGILHSDLPEFTKIMFLHW